MQVLQQHFWLDEPFTRPLPDRPLVVDGFAGGGGASTGLEWATGHQVDIAINHDPRAIAMHQNNHPQTRHYIENIWDVDPVEVCEGRDVDAAWFSPDCTHFSKARGSKPVRKEIRGLAWVVIKWAETVRPRIIFVENVEEFRTWGPVDEATNMPIKDKAGVTFELWKEKLRELGYTVEDRVLKACDYGAPTTRKRLYVIARRDGKPIVWPDATHGSPRQIEKNSNLQSWKTAADIIDWSIPCPSIFLSKDEAKAIGCKRPLANKTMTRIAEGVKRYIIENPEPFIVSVNHGGSHFRGQPMSRPLATITGKNSFGVVTPFVSRMFGKGVGTPADKPIGSLTSQNKSALVTPFLTSLQQGGSLRAADEPMRTITASDGDCNLVVAPTLVQTGYGERAGQSPRALDLNQPLGTVVAGGSKHALVAAFIAKHFGGQTGASAEMPFPTITQRGTQNQLVAACLIKNNHGEKQSFPVEEPLRTICAQGTHHAQVQAFLMSYYGNSGFRSPGDPLPTVTSKDRLALGIVIVNNEPYQIVDIGMRMLTPRELFNAQGFPTDYDIETGVDGKPATKSEQVARCGNSVCPQVAAAIAKANI